MEDERRLTDGRGFDTVIDASGSIVAAGQAIDLAEGGATILWPAVYGKDVEIGVSLFTPYAKALTITSTFVSPHSFPRAMSLPPRLRLEPLITDITPLVEIREACEQHRSETPIKIVVKPSQVKESEVTHD